MGEPDRPTPLQRGFDRFYGILDGATHFFSPHCIFEDDHQVQVSPTDYYFTDVITDKAIGMIEESAGMDKPFFLYLAHAAPHWPMHAHEEDIARYDGVYGKGWDAIRTARHEEMLSRGMLQHRWAISPRDPDAPAWSDAQHRDWEASRMAVYAAMVDSMDQSIGRVVNTLKRLGQFEDTVIMFLSDNGGCAEFMADVHNDGRNIEMGNRPVQTPDGESFMPLLQGRPWTRDQPIAWEHEGNCAIRQGNLKLVKKFEQPWELYDMEQDRTELHDLAPRNAALQKTLEGRYNAWAQAAGVQDWKTLVPKLLAAWSMDDVHG
jgi:arylsulfatase